LKVGQPLPLYPDNRTYLLSGATSQTCQKATSRPRKSGVCLVAYC